MNRPLTARAPAKVNLTLHVLGRRPDGYHELESLVAFSGVGDTLTLEPGGSLRLTVGGAMASQAGPVEQNLILKAASALGAKRPNLRVGAFHLVKRLPAAAGLGGGSSDAAAALRLIARLNGIDIRDPAVVEAARETGADVPVCLTPRMRMMYGAGERLGPVLAAQPLFAVLVNPGVPVETAAVFRALKLQSGQALTASDHPPIGRGDLLSALAEGRNDLEPPAVALAPVIEEALIRLREMKGCRLARMSGSGATVFGLFDDCRSNAAAAKVLLQSAPGWWVKATIVR